jgi:hypothetical protein
MILYSLHGHERSPSMEEAAAKLGVPLTALDRDYGVVLLDPKKGIYGVAVNENADTGRALTRPGVSGPWAAPPIEPFRRDPDPT